LTKSLGFAPFSIVRRVMHPLAEVLLMVVCGTMADCDDYEGIAAWGAAHLHFLRRYVPL